MGFFKYLWRYRISDMIAMVRNAKREPFPCDASLAGKCAVITGATSGIGRETARLFASRGARLIFINRDEAKSRALEEELRREFNADVATLLCDFSSLAQVRRVAEELLRLECPIDILVLNAGVYYSQKTLTEDGIEMVFQVNHLSSFLLLRLLEERLIADARTTARPRVILVNSEGHRFALNGVPLNDPAWDHVRFTGLKSYGVAKTAQLLCMQRFAERFADTGVTINAMHPGNVRSNIGAQNGERYLRFKEKHILKNALGAEVSARALLYLAASAEVASTNGNYYSFTFREHPAPHATDPAMVGPVWDYSSALSGLS